MSVFNLYCPINPLGGILNAPVQVLERDPLRRGFAAAAIGIGGQNAMLWTNPQYMPGEAFGQYDGVLVPQSPLVYFAWHDLGEIVTYPWYADGHVVAVKIVVWRADQDKREPIPSRVADVVAPWDAAARHRTRPARRPHRVSPPRKRTWSFADLERMLLKGCCHACTADVNSGQTGGSDRRGPGNPGAEQKPPGNPAVSGSNGLLRQFLAQPNPGQFHLEFPGRGAVD